MSGTSDQYVIREYLAYKLANLVTPLSFRARLARATYVEARSKKRISTHSALFLEHENDVARRLGGREVRQPHMVFNEFDKDALTTTMLLEYMLGNTDYSIWALHNVRDRAGQDDASSSRWPTISICPGWCTRRTRLRIRGCPCEA